MIARRAVVALFLLLGAVEVRAYSEGDFLSPEERSWLQSAPRELRVAPDPFFPPLEFIDEKGEFQGIAIDYLRLIEKKLGVSFRVVRMDSFEAILEAVKRREIDIGDTIVDTPERSRFLEFSPPYISIPNVIVVRDDVSRSMSPRDLKDLKDVVLQGGYSIGDVLEERFGVYHARPITNPESALKDLSFGRIDAMVGNLATISYYARKANLTNIRVAGDCGYADELSFASRSDWPLLGSVIAKALGEISQAERDAIKDKWIKLETVRFYEDENFWLSAGAITLAILALFVVLYAWNRTLKAEVGRRTRELMLKNDELSRFVYTASHDLRSPLVTIKSFVGFLEQDVIIGDVESQMRDIGFIRSAADKMGTMLDEILLLSRIGAEELVVGEVSLREVVGAAAELVAGRIGDRGIRLAVSEDPVILMGDSRRLVQLFRNLLDNAAKYMGDQEAPRIDVGAVARGGELRIFVRDNGAGIDPRHQERLFGLFEKLEPGSEGVGLGLAIAKRIAETHGGRIWAESEGLGKGTTFFIVLKGARLEGL
ncbi:MAG: transporter substrate-binding domain-containing protein [Spirochaetes bacterium]|nr:transporter substrate-binding domain-containing protein [Spirochaetota bacterium]MBU1080090.1 transporter substrate-binding domain-containing protein [Spirochaetota bacterium]